MTHSAQHRTVGRPTIFGLLAAAVCVTAAAGCSMGSKWTYPPDLASGLYHRAELKYQTRPIDPAGATSTTQLASYQVQPGASAAMANPSTRQTLTIHYPHPRNLPGMARAIVIDEAVSQNSGSQGNPWFDITAMLGRQAKPAPAQVVGGRSLDIPKAELDRMLAVMRNQGFYTPTQYEQGSTRLGTDMDGHTLSKTWDRIPELEQLVQRVRTQGEPLSNTR